uniref:Uncharacterized protein n=2 Tax=Tetranychus urticae TaxID=32264 RepID=T1KVH4_TETUR
MINPSDCLASKSCSPSCFTSVFSLANDTRKSECASRVNCLAQATFHVIQRGSFEEEVNITVVGYGLKHGVERTIAFTLNNTHEQIEYLCQMTGQGKLQAMVIQGSKSNFPTNEVRNVSGALICQWTFGKDDYKWPTHANYSKINLLEARNYQISLRSDNVTKVVARDLSKLPIYRMNFLRCCYKPHGGLNYLFISNQTTHDTNFYLQAFPPIPKTMQVNLVNPKGGEFRIICNSSNAFNASVKVGSRWAPMRDLRFYEIVKREAPFPDFRCVWSQPLKLVESSGSIDTRNGRYNLEIMSDGKSTYREPTIGLHGASHSLFASFTLILISVLFHLLV